jgi:hypothetical protein
MGVITTLKVHLLSSPVRVPCLVWMILRAKYRQNGCMQHFRPSGKPKLYCMELSPI